MSQPCSVDPEFLTRQEAADLLRVKPVTIDRYAKAGHLTRYRLPSTGTAGTRGGQILYRADDVRKLARREGGPDV